jgi:quercetin dioxygenase-like cupin family protein
MTSSLAVLLRGEESEGPPLHVHETWDEGFYVVAGEITFQAGDRRVTARPGTFVFAPRETPHTFANLSGGDARILLILTPAGFERYAESEERPPNTHAVGPPLAG